MSYKIENYVDRDLIYHLGYCIREYEINNSLELFKRYNIFQFLLGFFKESEEKLREKEEELSIPFRILPALLKATLEKKFGSFNSF